ncbi:hypothetical protein [Acetivibrio saccincola]|uniref:hypothetical protein n=1 Tax=Acetivibrio saccincola TaxID=1677857 RepID=UPI001F26FC4F|nr:hypothetical protein [Acetivibrio saccincola]
MLKKILETKRKYPKAPTTIIYDKLIKKGILKEGQISLTTLYRFLKFSNHESIYETEEKKEIKRFAHQYINELWYGDLMYGPYIQEEAYLPCSIRTMGRFTVHSSLNLCART